MNRLINYLYVLQTNADYLMVLSFVFLAVTILSGGVLFLVMRQKLTASRLEKSMDFRQKIRNRNKPALLEEEGQGISARIGNFFARFHNPSEEEEVHEIKLRLVRAGLRTKKAYRNYLASKVAAALFLSLFYLVKTTFYKFSPQAISISLLLFAVGFYLPDIFIKHLSQKRQEGMEKALPDALDLMVVCVESGLGLDMAFKRVGDELRGINKDLSDEFHLTNLEIRAGKPREESFRNMAWRTGVSEISNLMTMLIQTSRFGTSVAKALNVHADSLRTKRKQLAEERAAKMSIKIVFPLVVFILPALFIVLVGPAGIKVAKTLLPALGGG